MNAGLAAHPRVCGGAQTAGSCAASLSGTSPAASFLDACRAGVAWRTGQDESVSLPKADRAEAAAQLRRVLDAVETGDLAADGPVASALVRRLEGALLALDAVDSTRSVSKAAGEGARYSV